MQKTIKSSFAALAAALLGLGAAEARTFDRAPAQLPNANTYGFCYTGNGFSINIGGGYHSGYRSSSYHGGYNTHHSYRTRSRCIDRHYYTSGCYRYCRHTYLNERVASCGRVVSSWRTYKTTCLGRYR
ncbi:MAG: hypothetical protein AAGJ79_00750 [Verrucomicrobiota bacterium]